MPTLLHVMVTPDNNWHHNHSLNDYMFISGVDTSFGDLSVELTLRK